MTDSAQPRVRFLVGGVQKGGTTALAHCLAAHPAVALPAGKEAHVFDAPDFDDRATTADVDARYASHFAGSPVGALHGDATPIYCLHERFIERIARYNPAMKWILLLREPAERAISHYFMERARGDESWPLILALLLERWRLRGHQDDFSGHSPLRRHSYRLRGDYARQIDAICNRFPADQVLLVRSQDFHRNPAQVLQRVYGHLGLIGPVRLPEQTRMFEGNYEPPSRITRWLARRLLRAATRDLKARYDIDWL